MSASSTSLGYFSNRKLPTSRRQPQNHTNTSNNACNNITSNNVGTNLKTDSGHNHSRKRSLTYRTVPLKMMQFGGLVTQTQGGLRRDAATSSQLNEEQEAIIGQIYSSMITNSDCNDLNSQLISGQQTPILGLAPRGVMRGTKKSVSSAHSEPPLSPQGGAASRARAARLSSVLGSATHGNLIDIRSQNSTSNSQKVKKIVVEYKSGSLLVLSNN